MTRLQDGLRTLAEQAPRATLPADFFDLARARHRARRARAAATATVAVVVVLLVVGIGWAVRPAGPASTAAGTTAPGIPTTLTPPPWYTAAVEVAAIGPVAAIFGGAATTDDWNEGRFGAVAAAGNRYRVFDDAVYTPPGFEALLSPDGRYIARNHQVRSLVSGERIPVPGEIRAFSPDGALVVYETGNGEPRQSRVGVYDLARRTDVASLDLGDRWLVPGWSAALSGDHRRLALQVGDELRLYTVGRDTPDATIRLSSETLAGPGAWLPGGTAVATAHRDADDRWRLVVRDARTGLPADAATPADPAPPAATGARYVRLLGWRADGTAVAITGVPRPGAGPAQLVWDHAWGPFTDHGSARARLVALRPGATAQQVLLETPDGISELDVAADLALAGAFRDGTGPTDYGALRHPVVFVSAAAASVAAAVLLAVVLGRRRAHRRR
ncbi:hypothetical protein Drose_01475 [Dactylosporangium roseum]|uniref:Uncharacterized protein n=1 Tax=Dactylosporangium roseum TaxID=47989 RepID=A0ABY5Z4P1_9ACTN|nr:hypothetical protein [Dactylosporangium roseum]UWZ37025.1 hypothetical protein Drose_01475 [Dactylosporangium roseum]